MSKNTHFGVFLTVLGTPPKTPFFELFHQFIYCVLRTHNPRHTTTLSRICCFALQTTNMLDETSSDSTKFARANLSQPKLRVIKKSCRHTFFLFFFCWRKKINILRSRSNIFFFLEKKKSSASSSPQPLALRLRLLDFVALTCKIFLQRKKILFSRARK